MNCFRLLVFILLSAWSSATCSLAADMDPVARVVVVRGTVTASSPQGIARPLQREGVVLLSDTIRTGENSKAQFMFQDQTLITLGPQGELKVKDYVWQAAEKQGTLSVSINQGAFRVIGGLITKHSPQNFRAETPPATIGIRGSSFAGEVHDKQLSVVFLGGKGIIVGNQAGTVEISTPMQGTEVTYGAAPRPPVSWSNDQLTPLRELGVWIGPISEVHTIVNQSDNRGAANLAIGAGNRANLGSVAIEQSRAQGTVVNRTDNRNAVNAAIGTNNTANLGAVDLKGTIIRGAVTNETENQGSVNVAVGVGNEASTGSVKIK